jgi:hypothetical protein
LYQQTFRWMHQNNAAFNRRVRVTRRFARDPNGGQRNVRAEPRTASVLRMAGPTKEHEILDRLFRA